MGVIVARLPSLCVLCVLCILSVFGQADAHDIERTQVVMRFGRDGSFTIDVSNDPLWLRDRLRSIPGPFADRIVLWVDGREVRPESVDLRHGADRDVQLLRGHMPMEAKTLRWFYGLVVDPYPLTIHRADGRIVVEEVQGNAWSGTIDLSGQFRKPRWFSEWLFSVVLVVATLLVPPIVWLWRIRR